ncbi:sensor histidine kinase [Paenibacillus eucommiae]|uniref:Two-component system sensor histidine kinase YesM n=1 Tax=Paenibacillus eucommiae TaxID=1355755 RepID=A0ABS4ISI4_9BACL|nr:histidine kinase [Paenibacillus eucommiae]MBP1990534.1 two-component system sensor histidine kinase YesM [Paenibacillus eucommiae]
MKLLRDIPYNLRNLFRLRFYNRLMLYNTLIFLLVAYLLAFLASRYASELDTVKQLQQSRDALSAVFSFYNRKHDNFSNLVYTLYDSAETHNALSMMLESTSDDKYENDPFTKQKIVKVMQDIAVQDRDISLILIYKTLTDIQYVYNSNNKFIDRVGEDFPFFNQLKQKTAGRYIFGTQNIESGSLSQKVYGISGTLGTKEINRNAGQLLVTYNTQALEAILQEYNGKTQGRFVIVTNNGEIILDSNSQYGRVTFPLLKLLQSGVHSASINDKPYYIQTIANENRNYIAANLVPKAEIDQKNASIRFLIYGVFTAMAFVCAILYSIAGTFVSRRVNAVILGMKRVSSNNLSYRIPIYVGNDEFTEIVARFNSMCDELQATINREYINEIRKKNAELNALQAGINPHFLYNTLEAIRIKAIDDGNNDVAEMIMLLAHLYRSIVRDHTFITIRKEINMCGMYLSILSLRYASNLEYEINIEPQMMEYGIPKNLLQPIIENYFVHGIRDNNESNRFIIRGFLQDGDICFIFEDNGLGMNKSRLEHIQNLLKAVDSKTESSYGLSNVHERIYLVYGNPYGLWLESEENCETRVIVRIKAMTCEELDRNLSTIKNHGDL